MFQTQTQTKPQCRQHVGTVVHVLCGAEAEVEQEKSMRAAWAVLLRKASALHIKTYY